MGPSPASPQGRLRYTWGDVVLTLAGVLATLYAMSKANQVAEQGGSLVPFWVAYAAGVAAAACWWVYYVLHPQAVRRSRATGPTRRTVIAMWLVIVGLVLVQAFAAVGLQAVAFGASAGFVLSTTLGYGAYVLRERRRSRT
jgi:drug/metabolite transporter (DMT)-like permease